MSSRVVFFFPLKDGMDIMHGTGHTLMLSQNISLWYCFHSPVAFGLKESQVRKESDFFKVTTNHMYLMSVDPCKAQPWAVLQCLK